MVKKAWDLMHGVAERFSWAGPLLARLTLGYVFVPTGWGKLHNLPSVIEFFTSLHIPLPQVQAPMVSTIELVCGLLLAAGLATRLCALLLSGTMAVALITAKLESIASLNDLVGTSEFLYLVLLLWLFTAGAGAFSLDHIFKPSTRR